MIDRLHIGREFEPVEIAVEAGRLRLFAKVVGETNPIYSDTEAARAAGHRDILAMPTMAFCLEMDGPDPFGFMAVLGIDIARVLHGEQAFKYHQPICAGDSLTFKAHIRDIFDKKNGSLEFVVQEFTVHNQAGQRVAEMTRTVVVRN